MQTPSNELSRGTPMAHVEDKLLDHDYDGIRELDNKLPGWWLMILYGSVVFAVLYMLWFHVLRIGDLSADEYQKEMNPAYVRVRAADEAILGVFKVYHSPYYNPHGDVTPRLASLQTPAAAFVLLDRESDSTTYAALTDQASLEAGKDFFIKVCSSCHGRLGEGGVGPNLTDDYWIHGAGISNIVKSIEYGYPAKGMVSWRGYLNKDEILQTASYITTLRGTHPPQAKAPEGELAPEYDSDAGH